MHSPVSTKFLLVPLAAWFVLASCKPVGGGEAGSKISALESGGTDATWRLKSLLNNAGDLTLERVAEGGAPDGSTVTEVAIEIATSPDGVVAASSLVDRNWIPMTTGVESETLKFLVVMTTKTQGTCYTKASVGLNGTSDAIACKDATSAGPNDPKVVEMRDSCRELAKQPIEATKPTEFFTTYDEKLNKEKCTCLNGKSRDLFFESYLVTKTNSLKNFQDDCKKALLTTDVSTSTSTATTYIDYQKQLTASATAGSGSGSSPGTGSGSGVGSGSGSGTGSPSQKDSLEELLNP